MPVSEATYERVAQEDPEGRWELVCGRLRSKPAMTTEHNAVTRNLARLLLLLLDEQDYIVATDNARLRVSSGSYYMPDLCVLPRAFERRLRERPGTFEVYDEAVPLVVEVWSPSTGDYDLDEKLREYQRRGDQEIWLIHPYERTLAAWRRNAGAAYVETIVRGGTVRPAAFPNITVEVERLFL